MAKRWGGGRVYVSRTRDRIITQNLFFSVIYMRVQAAVNPARTENRAAQMLPNLAYPRSALLLPKYAMLLKLLINSTKGRAQIPHSPSMRRGQSVGRLSGPMRPINAIEPRTLTALASMIA